MSCLVCFFLGRHYSGNIFYSHGSYGGTTPFPTTAVHLEQLLGIAKAKITLPHSANSIMFQVHQNYFGKSKVHTQVLGKYNKGDEIDIFATPSNDGKSTIFIFYRKSKNGYSMISSLDVDCITEHNYFRNALHGRYFHGFGNHMIWVVHYSGENKTSSGNTLISITESN